MCQNFLVFAKGFLFQNLRAWLNFPIGGVIIRPYLRFLPVSFPVFPRQIAHYLPLKNRKIYSKEIPKPGSGKIQSGSIFYTFF